MSRQAAQRLRRVSPVQKFLNPKSVFVGFATSLGRVAGELLISWGGHRITLWRALGQRFKAGWAMDLSRPSSFSSGSRNTAAELRATSLVTVSLLAAAVFFATLRSLAVEYKGGASPDELFNTSYHRADTEV